MKSWAKIMALALLFSTAACHWRSGPLAFGQGAEEVNQWALRDMAGRWQVVSTRYGGDNISNDDDLHFVISGRELAVFEKETSEKRPNQTYRISLDATRIPHRIRIDFPNGAESDQVLIGIYEIKEEMLKFRFAQIELATKEDDNQEDNQKGNQDNNAKEANPKDLLEAGLNDQMTDKWPTDFQLPMGDDWEFVLKRVNK